MKEKLVVLNSDIFLGIGKGRFTRNTYSYICHQHVPPDPRGYRLLLRWLNVEDVTGFDMQSWMSHALE